MEEVGVSWCAIYFVDASVMSFSAWDFYLSLGFQSVLILLSLACMHFVFMYALLNKKGVEDF